MILWWHLLSNRNWILPFLHLTRNVCPVQYSQYLMNACTKTPDTFKVSNDIAPFFQSIPSIQYIHILYFIKASMIFFLNATLWHLGIKQVRFWNACMVLDLTNIWNASSPYYIEQVKWMVGDCIEFESCYTNY